MQDIEPFEGWYPLYDSSKDRQNPLYGETYDLSRYSSAIYGYYIHPLWDYIGSETLYIKILYVDYKRGFAILELFGEWNDTLHNDVMHLKRNIIDAQLAEGISDFILIGENVFNFHGSDDCYYEEWMEEVEDGWIAALEFREHVHAEWRKFNIDSYFNYGNHLEFSNWRTYSPTRLWEAVTARLEKRLPGF
jgi:hypothetical protein